MPGGVCSSWASSRPLPVWVSHGEGRVGVGRRRHPLLRHARRIRRQRRRAREPRCGARVQARVARHPLRGAHGRLDRRRGGARPALRPSAVALRQLGHRGNDGCVPPHACDHRAQAGREDRGHLPRPSRLHDGVHLPLGGSARPTARAAPCARPRHRAGVWPICCASCSYNDLAALHAAPTSTAARSPA